VVEHYEKSLRKVKVKVKAKKFEYKIGEFNKKYFYYITIILHQKLIQKVVKFFPLESYRRDLDAKAVGRIS